ncbi:MAG: tyrosine recombinase XerD [Firmicutes bacterium]|nr:tyrosine recombinase XerD [Bacillota bacterium]
MSIQHYLDLLSVERGLAPSTLAAYQSDLRQFAAFLQKRDVEDLSGIDRETIQRFFEQIHECGAHPATAARKMTAVRGWCEWLHEEGFLQEDPAAYLATPKKQRRLPVVLSVEQVMRLLSQPTTTTAAGKRDQALLGMLYGAGLRASEVCTLTVADVSLTTRQVRCFGKGSKERYVPLPSVVIEWVTSYIKDVRPLWSGPSSREALFLSQRGTPLSRQAVWSLVKRYGRQANLPPEVTTHMLRHSFATHLLAGGASLRDVQLLLGHADLATTEIYTHLFPQQLRDSYDQTHPRA